jgi:hypothetical protein
MVGWKGDLTADGLIRHETTPSCRRVEAPDSGPSCDPRSGDRPDASAAYYFMIPGAARDECCDGSKTAPKRHGHRGERLELQCRPRTRSYARRCAFMGSASPSPLWELASRIASNELIRSHGLCRAAMAARQIFKRQSRALPECQAARRTDADALDVVWPMSTST